MNRVNWKARNEHEYISNYKLVQKGFDKMSQKKHIEVCIFKIEKFKKQVAKLSKCKYQDNLEFAQWFKAMYEMHGGLKCIFLLIKKTAEGYHPEERRGNCEVELLNEKMGTGLITGQPAKRPSANIKTMKQNTKEPGLKPKITDSKKENVLDNGNRPIKKITGVREEAKQSEAEHQIKRIMELVSIDEDPAQIVHEIRNMFGIRVKQTQNVQQQQPPADLSNQHIEQQLKQEYQKMRDQQKAEKQQEQLDAMKEVQARTEKMLQEKQCLLNSNRKSSGKGKIFRFVCSEIL